MSKQNRWEETNSECEDILDDIGEEIQKTGEDVGLVVKNYKKKLVNEGKNKHAVKRVFERKIEPELIKRFPTFMNSSNSNKKEKKRKT